MITDDVLKKLIAGSNSITEDEKKQLTEKLSTASAEEKQNIYLAFMIESVLTEKMPQIKEGLIKAFDDIFDKTDKAYKKYEKNLISQNEKKQKAEELGKGEALINQI